MIRRLIAVILLTLLIITLPACAPEPVQQGMVTADGVTALVSTLTNGETLTVSVTLTNGSGTPLWLAAPETTDGSTVFAHYLQLSLEGSLGARRDFSETGELRRMVLDGRESYLETCDFTAVTLPATLTITLQKSESFGGPFTETTLTIELH